MEEIKKKYGSYWKYVEKGHMGNGWISWYKADWGELTPKISKMDLEHSGTFWRMRTLSHLPGVVETLSL